MIDLAELKALAIAARDTVGRGVNWYQAVLDFSTAANPAAVLELISRIEEMDTKIGLLIKGLRNAERDLASAKRASESDHEIAEATRELSRKFYGDGIKTNLEIAELWELANRVDLG